MNEITTDEVLRKSAIFYLRGMAANLSRPIAHEDLNASNDE